MSNLDIINLIFILVIRYNERNEDMSQLIPLVATTAQLYYGI